MKKILGMLIIFLIPSCTAFASQDTVNYQAAEVMTRIEANYNQLQTMSGRIKQTRSYGNNKIQSELSFFFKSPDKLYLDYLTPVRQIIIANGTSCWGYSPDDNRAEKVDLTEANMTFSPVKLLGIDILDELKKAFNLTIKENQAERIVILASPRTGGKFISQILIIVDPIRWVISSLKIMDKKGDLISQSSFEEYSQVNNIWFPLRIKAKSLLGKQVINEEISLRRLKINQSISDERFEFVPPVL
ncbi:MAG: outer membrane lipoprotein carrier protein LolA [Candidatus Desantisbacteria bacterium]